MMSILDRLLWPKARLAYPNIHGVLLGLTLVHLSLGLTSVFGPHTDLWYYYGGRPGLIVLGVTHFIVAGLLMVGYHTNAALARFGLLVSITMYLLKSCLFTAAIIRIACIEPASFEEPVFTLGLALLSVAAYRTKPSPRIPIEEGQTLP